MSAADEVIFPRVVIAGVGLIGGSLALAGKKAGIFGVVAGYGRTTKTLQRASDLGIIDETHTDIKEAAKGADLLFVATPVESVVEVILSAAPALRGDCIITDGGSVKAPIVTELEDRLPNPQNFVGGHPIAGTEKSGPEAASAHLYENRYIVLTPTERTNPDTTKKVDKMWRACGAKTIIMTPDEHDHMLAMISHLPHFVAYSLVEALDEADTSGAMRKFIAGGYRDTTRIAASHPRMWRDIFSMNRDQVLESVIRYERYLAEYRELLEQGDFDGLEKRLEKVRTLRQEMEDI